MSSIVNQDSKKSHFNCALETGMQKNSHRFGQLRAPKRSMGDCRYGSQRTHKNQNVVLSKSVPLAELNEETGGRLSVCEPTITDDTLTHSSHSESPPSSVHTRCTSEHKRPRPEVHTFNNLNEISSTGCLEKKDSSLLIFEAAGADSSVRDRLRPFTCEPSLINEERLNLLLSKESHYYPNNAFLYYVNPEVEDKVDAVIRNEAVNRLRFMHSAYFNLPTEAFCKAVNLIDRFIVKVKVKPKYMACVATASYCVASKLSPLNKDAELPDLDTLVRITGCGGNAADLIRMEEILASKLSHDLDGVNAFDFLRLFIDSVVENNAHDTSVSSDLSHDEEACISPTAIDVHIHDPYTEPTRTIGSGKNSMVETARVQRTQLIKRLMTRLQLALCSLEIYRFRPACVALGILAQARVEGLLPLCNMCQIDGTDVVNCAALLDELYNIDFDDSLPCSRRPLVWSLSRRTLCRIGYSSPTPLDTITEDCEPPDEDEWLLPLLFEP